MSNQRLSPIDKAADITAKFSGSASFLLINLAVFAVWLAVNTLTPFRFDPYPMGALTLVVSLEAILLSVLILMSENRQSAHDREMAQHDLEVDMRAEQMIVAIEQKVDRIEALVLQLKGVQE